MKDETVLLYLEGQHIDIILKFARTENNHREKSSARVNLCPKESLSRSTPMIDIKTDMQVSVKTV